MKANARATRQAIASASDTAQALLIARENADAALAHVKTANSVAEHQLRAYLALSLTKIKRDAAADDDGGMFYTYKFALQNLGLTPAIKVEFRMNRFIGVDEPKREWLAQQLWAPMGSIERKVGVYHPDTFRLDRATIQQLRTREIRHSCLIDWRYVTVFGKRHTMFAVLQQTTDFQEWEVELRSEAEEFAASHGPVSYLE